MLNKKNILVSGVSRGLGLEIAEVMLANGASVYGISRSQPIEVSELQLRYPKTFHHLEWDVSSTGDMKKRSLKIGLA